VIYDRITKENFYLALSFAREIFPYEFVNGKLSFEGAYRESIDLNQPEFAYYIVKNADSCPIGITGHYTEDDKMDKIWLGWFGVHPRYRGKGYGTEILRSTAKIVAKLGYNKMSIYSGQRIEEHNAHKLYVKNGFEKTGEGILEVESVFFFEGPVPVQISMEEMYRDQAGINGCYVSSFYTPQGIRKMDSLFCNRIMAFRNGEHYKQLKWDGKKVDHVWKDTKESLTKDITENNHLHENIKENLLFNLNRED
jgi:GNAT superfamily N-acetyltransferase